MTIEHLFFDCTVVHDGTLFNAMRGSFNFTQLLNIKKSAPGQIGTVKFKDATNSIKFTVELKASFGINQANI